MTLCRICNHHFNTTTNYPMNIPCGHTFCWSCIENSTIKVCAVCGIQWTTSTKNYAMAELLEIRHLNPNICALFKIALVGEISVGKTSVVRAFKRKNFIPLVRPTIGYDFEYIDEVRNGNAYRLEMWDTAGEERYQSVSKSHYKNANLIIAVYSVDNKESFARIQRYWLRQISQHAQQDILVMLLGNKIDVQHREVQEEQVESYCKREHLLHSIVSCNTNENIANTWSLIIRELIQKLDNARPAIVSNIIQDKSAISTMTNSTKGPGMRLEYSGDEAQQVARSRRCC